MKVSSARSAVVVHSEFIVGCRALICATGFLSIVPVAVADSAGSKGEALEEIVVTAQKRDERLQDVPVPLSVVNPKDLLETQEVRFQDYYATVPGLALTPSDQGGAPLLAIRGITTGVGNPTVGIVVDDVPYGSSSVLGGGTVAPDLDPNDLARIEVLRGPQGTLYGANSIGGLIKFVTLDPSTQGFSGNVQGDANNVVDGSELGYGLRGAVNVPLSDTWAARASGFYRADPGYIDNPVYHLEGVNRGHADGGLLTTLWRPSEEFSLKLSALVQHLSTYGASLVNVQAGLGDLQQNSLPNTGGYDNTIQVYSATAKAKLGSTDLTTITGWNVNGTSTSFDFTPGLGALSQVLFPNSNVTGTVSPAQGKTKKFTQEIRLSSSASARIDWLLGAFYAHESSDGTSGIYAVDPAETVVGTLFVGSNLSTYEEYAAFGDLTIHITDRFNVQLGGRESHNNQSYTTTEGGLLLGNLVIPKFETKDSSFTYLVTPQFKVTPDLMTYARVATGYRPGGPNFNTNLPGVPVSYAPDKTRNYELGLKGDFLDRSVSFDTSIYYIQWNDIQIQLINPQNFAGYFANGSRAKSEGVELSFEARPWSGLRLDTWVVWDDAALTEPFPATSSAYGVPGDRLPFSSRWSGYASLEQDFPLWGEVRGFAGGVVSYVGDREGYFTGSPQRQSYPEYAKTDIRVGAKFNSSIVTLYVNNVADRRGVLTGGVGTLTPTSFSYIQPRTVGISASKTF